MEVSVGIVDEEEEEIVEVVEVMIHWCATSAGCMAIWPVAVLNPGSHKVLVPTVLKMHNRSNAGVEALGEVMGGKSGLVEWV